MGDPVGRGGDYVVIAGLYLRCLNQPRMMCLFTRLSTYHKFIQAVLNFDQNKRCRIK